MKTEIKIKQRIEKEETFHIEFPFYSKTIPFFDEYPIHGEYYKVISEDKIIKVWYLNEDACSVTMTSSIEFAFDQDAIPSNQDEFNEMFNKVFELCQK